MGLAGSRQSTEAEASRTHRRMQNTHSRIGHHNMKHFRPCSWDDARVTSNEGEPASEERVKKASGDAESLPLTPPSGTFRAVRCRTERSRLEGMDCWHERQQWRETMRSSVLRYVVGGRRGTTRHITVRENLEEKRHGFLFLSFYCPFSRPSRCRFAPPAGAIK